MKADETYKIVMVVNSEGKVTFEGLPQQFVGPVNMFTDEE